MPLPTRSRSMTRRAFNSEQHFREYALLAEKYRQTEPHTNNDRRSRD